MTAHAVPSSQQQAARTTAHFANALTLLALTVLMTLAAVFSDPAVAGAQAARRAVWDRVDVTVELREDSSFHVTERDRVLFVGGPFRRGYREIPLARIERIDTIRVFGVTGRDLRPFRYVPPRSFSHYTPNTYTYQTVGTLVRIEWSFPPTTSQSRTFQIAFDAFGALRVYDDEPAPYQQIAWAGVDRELTKDARVNMASLSFVLPRAVDPDDTVIDGPGGNLPGHHTADGKSWTWSATNLGPGESLYAILKFPPLVAATKPSWQDASDRGEQLSWGHDARSPLLNLFFLGLGLLIAVGGGLAVLAAWWTRGRDPEIGPIPEFIATPPGDLSPAVAGALVDEEVNQQDIVATLVDLSRRGVLRIDRPVVGGDFALTLLQKNPHITPFERALLRALFGSLSETHRPVALSAMKARFTQAGSELRRLLYDELVQRGFFTTRPSRIRIFWRMAGTILLGVGLFAAFIGIGKLYDIGPTVWMPGAALLLIGLLVWTVARFMPRKTPAGAQAAAQWRAFKTYLESIDRFEQIDGAQELFDRYLPYAVAFGLEKSWIETFSRVPTPSPSWYGTLDWTAFKPVGGVRSSSVRGAGGGSWTAPSLQGVSNQAAQSLQASSNSLFALFNSTGQTFSGTSSSSSMGANSSDMSGFSGSLSGLKLAGIVFKGLSGGGGGGFS